MLDFKKLAEMRRNETTEQTENKINSYYKKQIKTTKMSQKLYGSLCLTTLLEKAKEQHSAFTRAINGKIYFNVTQWINDEKDTKGNDSSILLASKKDKKDAEGKVYIGNLKISENNGGAPLTAQAVANEIPDNLDDLPF